MCCMHLWRGVSQEELSEMKQCTVVQCTCARWLQGCVVGEAQSAARGASAAVLVVVLMVPDPTSGYQGGEHSHSARAGLPLLHPGGSVVCAYSPTEPPPKDRQHCPWCLFTCKARVWHLPWCGLLQLRPFAAQHHHCSQNMGRGGKAVLRREALDTGVLRAAIMESAILGDDGGVGSNWAATTTPSDQQKWGVLHPLLAPAVAVCWEGQSR